MKFKLVIKKVGKFSIKLKAILGFLFAKTRRNNVQKMKNNEKNSK